MEKSKIKEYQDRQKGKVLFYVSPCTKKGKIYVNIKENDLKDQEEHCKTDIRGYVIGDTPYLKTIETYISHVWPFAQKPHILQHDEGYFIF